MTDREQAAWRFIKCRRRISIGARAGEKKAPWPAESFEGNHISAAPLHAEVMQPSAVAAAALSGFVPVLVKPAGPASCCRSRRRYLSGLQSSREAVTHPALRFPGVKYRFRARIDGAPIARESYEAQMAIENIMRRPQ